MTGTATDTFGVFGPTGVIVSTEPAALGQARAIAYGELSAVDLACSRFRPDSELSRLNQARGEPTRISELFVALISGALGAAELTGGDVDPTCGNALVSAGYDRDFADLGEGTATAAFPPGPVPGWRAVRLDPRRAVVQLVSGAQLDLGSTAKAWAADHCAALIAGRLGCGVLVSLGGDVAVAGPPPRHGWQIRGTDDHPPPADASGQSVTISSGGPATPSTTLRAWETRSATMHHTTHPPAR